MKALSSIRKGISELSVTRASIRKVLLYICAFVSTGFLAGPPCSAAPVLSSTGEFELTVPTSFASAFFYSYRSYSTVNSTDSGTLTGMDLEGLTLPLNTTASAPGFSSYSFLNSTINGDGTTTFLFQVGGQMDTWPVWQHYVAGVSYARGTITVQESTTVPFSAHYEIDVSSQHVEPSHATAVFGLSANEGLPHVPVQDFRVRRTVDGLGSQIAEGDLNGVLTFEPGHSYRILALAASESYAGLTHGVPETNNSALLMLIAFVGLVAFARFNRFVDA